MILNYIIYILSIIIFLNVFFILIENNEDDEMIIFDDSDNLEYQNIPELSFSNHGETSFVIEDNLDENEYSVSYKYIEIKKCKYLITELISCINMKNEVNEKCQKLYNEKVEDLEKCDFIITNYYMEEMKENKIYFNLKNEKNIDIIDYEENEEDFNDILKLSKDYELNEEIEIEEINNKYESLKEESPKENFIIINNKDCTEYELSKKDENYIVCTKYE